jgi:protein-disulfide isomerase
MTRRTSALFLASPRAVALGGWLLLAACGGPTLPPSAGAPSALATPAQNPLPPAKILISASAPAVDVDSPSSAAQNPVNADASPRGQPTAPAPLEQEVDTTVWKVPVFADDPLRGPRDAPVTIVIFSEFQCPFCKRVEETLVQVSKTYGAQVRLVWKDNPLPFHPRARPAAAFARFAYSRLGDKGFWAAHDALFESAPKLEDEDLGAIAKKLGLPWQPAQGERDLERFRSRLDQSIELAADFQARGTPHFFINGVRLSGAQPFEKFQALIEQQLALVKELKAKGITGARVYEFVTKDGQGPPRPETKEVPAPDASAPFRGNPAAKVVIQEWSDFQCSFCARVQVTLRELEKQYPGQLKLVFRHLPLPFHEHASLAAEAAQEAFAQKGNAGFWSFHDALFAAQSQPEGLSRANLEELARRAGLDLVRFKAALDARRHEPKVRADAEAAVSAGINGTPTFVINGYLLSGAQPTAAFSKLVRAALADTKKKSSTSRPAQPVLR